MHYLEKEEGSPQLQVLLHLYIYPVFERREKKSTTNQSPPQPPIPQTPVYLHPVIVCILVLIQYVWLLEPKALIMMLGECCKGLYFEIS